MSDEPNNEEEVEKGAPMWVVTFGDLMSLLLCFFVLLLSFSETDKAIYKEVAGSLTEAFGVQRDKKVLDTPMGQSIIGREFDQQIIPTVTEEEIIAAHIKKEIKGELEKTGGETGEGAGGTAGEESGGKAGEGDSLLDNLIKIEAGENKVTIKLMGESTFDSGKAKIKPNMVSILKKIASIIKTMDGNITVAGHTDNIPIFGGAYKSNLVLSMARASNVAELMINKIKIKPERISAMGYGKYRPQASNLTREGRQKNRRVEIIIHTKKDSNKNVIKKNDDTNIDDNLLFIIPNS